MACGLAPAQFRGRLRVFQVVESGGSTAHFLVGDVHQREIADLFEQPAGRQADALSVRQVAGVVIGHGRRPQQGACLLEAERVEKLRDIAHRRRVVVFLHRRPAARGVGHDGVHVRREEPGVVVGERKRPRFETAVEGERAAASLIGGDENLDAVGSKHAQCCVINRRPEHTLHAAGQKRDTGAARAGGGDMCRKRIARGQSGR